MTPGRAARIARAAAFAALLGAALPGAGCGPKPLYRAGRPGGPGFPRSTDASSSVPADSTRASGPAAAALAEATEPWLGTPYRYGGTSRRGVDCSALAVHLLDEVGVRLPRSVDGQRGVGREISRGDVIAGDLVFFRLESRRVNHVGIALDADRFVHASRSRGVRIDRFDDDYFGKRIVETRRVLEDAGRSSAPPAADAAP